MIIDIKKNKEFNKMNDAVKNIFSSYFVRKDLNLMIAKDEAYIIKNGFHFVEYFNFPITELIDTNTNIYINTRLIYETYRDNKKALTYLSISEDNMIKLLDNENKELNTIGKVFEGDANYTINYVNIMRAVKTSGTNIISSDFDSLKEKELTTIFITNQDSSKVFKARISEKIIPDIKKVKNIKFYCQEDIDDLFHLTIMCERENNNSYHIYKCINY